MSAKPILSFEEIFTQIDVLATVDDGDINLDKSNEVWKPLVEEFFPGKLPRFSLEQEYFSKIEGALRHLTLFGMPNIESLQEKRDIYNHIKPSNIRPTISSIHKGLTDNQNQFLQKIDEAKKSLDEELAKIEKETELADLEENHYFNIFVNALKESLDIITDKARFDQDLPIGFNWCKLTAEYCYMHKAVSIYGRTLQYTATDLKKNLDLAIAATAEDPNAFGFVSSPLRTNIELLKHAIKTTRYDWFKKWFPEEEKDNLELFLELIKVNTYAIGYASERIQDNDAIAVEVVARGGKGFHFLSRRLRSDRTLFLMTTVQTEEKRRAFYDEAIQITDDKQREAFYRKTLKELELNSTTLKRFLGDYRDIGGKPFFTEQCQDKKLVNQDQASFFSKANNMFVPAQHITDTIMEQTLR